MKNLTSLELDETCLGLGGVKGIAKSSNMNFLGDIQFTASNVEMLELTTVEW